MDDIVTNKIQSIQRCTLRAREEYLRAGDTFRTNETAQDAAVLNVTRACQQAIDLANHIVIVYKLGIPSTSTESFELLDRQGVIDPALAEKMKRMLGFRDSALHLDQQFDLDIVEAVVTRGLDDFATYADAVLRYLREHPIAAL